MARTAIPVTTVSEFQEGTELSYVNGDAANWHSLDLSCAPNLVLHVFNAGTTNEQFAFVYPACNSTYNETVSGVIGIDAGEHKLFLIDPPLDVKQTEGDNNNLLFINSAEADFSNVAFHAYTWNPTPGGGLGYKG